MPIVGLIVHTEILKHDTLEIYCFEALARACKYK